ncbi:DUF1028 domain-containing protein [Pseudooceanicola sp. CBS1P-1]|uniref:DUF1028 domain-containing protein n=1 Tax=Pseudooceanicola albus TaxID=2692189 RepID=A0A6L7G3J3_9RHOB|nr:MULTISPECIES: DUF1028 domain-containing protein [Pseudooceanicola]MBT9384990.1 DUF1028 domain-containing protein [Pseudooceanicola endophyticus]MXN18016.1 DUF1028 domain-containing protein [Pseudooceanicola albus]
MTYSILVRDPDTGSLAGAATTGSLCVGGWVLRGDLRAGMSASQGASPSTLWGGDVLAAMRAGATAAQAVRQITGADSGRGYRQLSALARDGIGASFTGPLNTPQMGGLVFDNGVAAGNLLSSTDVIAAAAETWQQTRGPIGERLIAALRAGEAAGSDSRGLLSAALLILHPDQAPLTLRIDYHPGDPIGALADLFARATSGDYAFWARQVPSLSQPERGLD